MITNKFQVIIKKKKNVLEGKLIRRAVIKFLEIKCKVWLFPHGKIKWKLLYDLLRIYCERSLNLIYLDIEVNVQELTFFI